MRKTALLLVAVVATLFFSGCLGGTPQEPGSLQGTVTIGPIWPAEPSGGSPPIPCAVYEARKVMVYDGKGAKLVKQVDIDCEGHYRVELAPGAYTVDINHLGVDLSPDVPAKIVVKSGETVTLNIDIDTGIR